MGPVKWMINWEMTPMQLCQPSRSYVQCLNTRIFKKMKLLHFAQNSIPKEIGIEPWQHNIKVVIAHPYCSSDPNGSKYEQYYQQKLMLHKLMSSKLDVTYLLQFMAFFSCSLAMFLHRG